MHASCLADIAKIYWTNIYKLMSSDRICFKKRYCCSANCARSFSMAENTKYSVKHNHQSFIIFWFLSFSGLQNSIVSTRRFITIMISNILTKFENSSPSQHRDRPAIAWPQGGGCCSIQSVQQSGCNEQQGGSDSDEVRTTLGTYCQNYKKRQN